MTPSSQKTTLRLADLALLALLLSGCGDRRQTINVGSATARVEIAATPRARAKGLSGRTSLPDGEGMLFIFPTPRKPAFWMKDTFVPLDIAFVTPDGRIAEIQTMEPESLQEHSPGEPAALALEMPAGWFEKNGVSAGDALGLPEDISRIEAQ